MVIALETGEHVQHTYQKMQTVIKYLQQCNSTVITTGNLIVSGSMCMSCDQAREYLETVKQ